jgi:pyruvate/2-oxoglutarate dehydrogenase complex dihydrolipoamide dehydrogenase (E3) component
VVVIGGGFNGSEIASACRALNIPVTLIESNATPLAGALGCVVGRAAAALQRANRVDLRCGTRVERLEGDADGHVRRVYLTGDDTPIEANVVVVALGAMPKGLSVEASSSPFTANKIASSGRLPLIMQNGCRTTRR